MNGSIRDPQLIQRIYETVARRESTYDGLYYTGVHTTGIFCRPSCRARTPKAENVSFYTSADEARLAGFRPCKRCKPEEPGPDGPEAALIQAAKKAIDSRFPLACSLSDLAAALHISPFYLQRVFKRHSGISPAEYTTWRRLEQAKEHLARTDMTVSDIARATGFSSAAYFSSVFTKHVGFSPSEFRRQTAE
jgi:AraC family transcriptional regulator, regulatory protein of adaptative response / methylphosphotriester-DNA alkyltransferase methyltransferase